MAKSIIGALLSGIYLVIFAAVWVYRIPYGAYLLTFPWWCWQFHDLLKYMQITQLPGWMHSPAFSAACAICSALINAVILYVFGVLVQTILNAILSKLQKILG